MTSRMSDLFQADPERTEATLDFQVREGVVTRNIETIEDEMFVRALDSRVEEGPCRWSPRVQPDGGSGLELRFPVRGDRVAYCETDEGQLWVLEWWPYD